MRNLSARIPSRLGLNRTFLLAVIVLGVLSARMRNVAQEGGVPQQDDAPVRFKEDVLPFLAEYCTGCHGGRRKRGGLALDGYKDAASLAKDREVWENVSRMLLTHEMPPEDKPQPTEMVRTRITSWIRRELERVDCSGQVDPGRVTIRRLNRAEYNNTIRDLVGVDFRPAEGFPVDEVGYGFDNIGDVLSMPPLLAEKYLDAAEKVVERAVEAEDIKRKIFISKPGEGKSVETCAGEILSRFAGRAYRRPLKTPELDRLNGLVLASIRAGDTFEEAIQVALKAILVSPHFLFRVEIDAGGHDAGAVLPVGDYDLASRLSYFLWSSMPDGELFRLAREKKLGDEKVLEAQVRRMLRDPKSRALVENFASQWLQTRFLERVSPDPELFPQYDEELRSAMATETLMFFAAVLEEDRSLLDFIDADFSFVNERLARHYGIEGVQGEAFRRVSLDGLPRGGVLTQASVLTITSNPTRTSPVKRGKWILEQILGTPPLPPPPQVEDLPEDQEAILSGSLRQRMEKHRADPNCAVCHKRMDALGFAFENFDAVGSWRDFDGEFLIDPSGTLPDGRSFDGPGGLKRILKSQETDFARSLAEKMLTYALGRGLEHYDNCAVKQIVEYAAESGFKLSSVIVGVVRSEPFRMRRGSGGT